MLLNFTLQFFLIHHVFNTFSEIRDQTLGNFLSVWIFLLLEMMKNPIFDLEMGGWLILWFDLYMDKYGKGDFAKSDSYDFNMFYVIQGITCYNWDATHIVWVSLAVFVGTSNFAIRQLYVHFIMMQI